jgi:hypothetical protein
MRDVPTVVGKSAKSLALRDMCEYIWSHEHVLRLMAMEDLKVKSKRSCIAGCCELTMNFGKYQHQGMRRALLFASE